MKIYRVIFILYIHCLSLTYSFLQRIPGRLGYLHPFGIPVSRKIPEAETLLQKILMRNINLKASNKNLEKFFKKKNDNSTEGQLVKKNPIKPSPVRPVSGYKLAFNENYDKNDYTNNDTNNDKIIDNNINIILIKEKDIYV